MQDLKYFKENLYIIKIKTNERVIYVRPVFLDSSCKSYKTERFCSDVDRNVMLFVETRGDNSEVKTCENIDTCKNKSKCRYTEKN